MNECRANTGEWQSPLQEEHHYVLPVGGAPVRCFLPSSLVERDWLRYQGELASLAGLPRSSGLARGLALYCLSPGGVDFDARAGRGSNVAHVPIAEVVYSRLRASSLRLPKNREDLLGFRRRIGLSDLPVRVGPCWAGGGSIHESHWVHPPANLVPSLLDDWFSFMWSSRLSWSLRLAMGIPQFLRIHPFTAANGKTVRAFAIKHGQAVGQFDAVAVALILLLQGRRHQLLPLWNELYAGKVSEYLALLSQLAAWISEHHQSELEAGSTEASSDREDDVRFDQFLNRFFEFADKNLP